METKQELFRLLEKFFNTSSRVLDRILVGGYSKITRSENPYISVQEIHRLAQIIALENPYIKTPTTNLNFKNFYLDEKLKIKNTITEANYMYQTQCININDAFIENLLNGKYSLGWLFNDIGHEQRHHLQYFPDSQSSSPSLELAKEVTSAITERNLSEEGVRDFYEYVEAQNSTPIQLFLNKIIKGYQREKKIASIQFGCYLEDITEIDARNGGDVFAKEMFEKLINDPECPHKLRDKLITARSEYNKYVYDYNENNDNAMKNFAHFKKQLKQVTDEILAKDPNVVAPNEIELLQNCVKILTQSMSIKDRILYFDWAIKNNYLDIANNAILISSDLNEEDLKIAEKYLNKLNTEHQLTTKNCPIFAYQYLQASNVDSRNRFTDLLCTQIKQGKITLFRASVEEFYGYIYNHEKIAQTLIEYTQNFCKMLKNKDPETPIFNYNHIMSVIVFYHCNKNLIGDELCDKLSDLYNWLYFNSNLIDEIHQSSESSKQLYFDIYGEKQFIESFGEKSLKEITSKQDELALSR